jgi:hypothetical protein
MALFVFPRWVLNGPKRRLPAPRAVLRHRMVPSWGVVLSRQRAKLRSHACARPTYDALGAFRPSLPPAEDWRFPIHPPKRGRESSNRLVSAAAEPDAAAAAQTTASTRRPTTSTRRPQPDGR